MNPMMEMGKMLLLLGVAVAAVGLLLMVAPRIPVLGPLPGDILLRRGNFTFYFPLASCILISVILTLLFSLFRR